jgi:hypothetical protein
MYDWPLYLFVFGLIAIVVAALIFSRKAMICVPVGYMAGFLLAWLLNTDGVDPGGGQINNAWIIWTVSFIVVVFAGVVWGFAYRIRKKKE